MRDLNTPLDAFCRLVLALRDFRRHAQMDTLWALWQSVIDGLRLLLFKKELEVACVGLASAGKTSLCRVLASSGEFSDQVVPTVGFQIRKIHAGRTTIRVWDLGGQARFRPLWARYCTGVAAIVYVVDSSLPLPASYLATRPGKAPAPRPPAPLKEAHSLLAPEDEDQPDIGQDSPVTSDERPAVTAPSSPAESDDSENPWNVATEELFHLLGRPQMAGIPLLVVGTKNDLPTAVEVDDVIRVMNLATIRGREVSCYSISAKSQANIDATLRWLTARNSPFR